MASTLEQLLEDGRAALDGGDWREAQSFFSLALEHGATAEAAYGLARAVEWAGDFETAIGLYEKAFTLFRRRGEFRLPALIAARELSFLYDAVYANAAAADGWLARATTLVSDAGDCVEAGWVHLAQCLGTLDPAKMRAHAAAATELGRRLREPDLEFCARSYEGLALVLGGRIAAGVRFIDEAAAAATSGEVPDYQAAGEIYCKMLLCSELTLDVRRAQQWMEVAAGFGHNQHAAWVPAICGMHYGGILTAAGRWAEAEDRLVRAIEDYDGGFRALRGGAVVRLADLRLRQGRAEEAATLLRGYESDPATVQPLARLRLMNGDAESAAAVLRRRLQAAAGSVLVAPEIALLAEVYLAARRPDEASGLGCELGVIAAATGLGQYAALAEYTVGLCRLAIESTGGAGASSGARKHLETALVAFGTAGLPLEQARCRLALARAVAADQPELAAAEALTALRDFQQLGARYDADAAAQILRSLGHRSAHLPRAGGQLTTRENQVLQLIADGLSNSQIAARLFISKRTVEHHIGSILAKLGLATRAEVQAYASRGHTNQPA
ncbi:response regulator transcription factor [Crystallibacter degradans]|uniref:response regulator transcription factor n=1 Tax=Crystallibacter degradans TaxID=2726743 RepID=UPI001474D24C|nr:response regulator transcription factor [Arthrobacter sp. SF27]NMR28255.1 response regulator transcription factor [Arthrobacter sp. SF27]